MMYYYSCDLEFNGLIQVYNLQNSDSSPEERVSGTYVEESSSEMTSVPPVTTVATKLPVSASVAVTRSTRRRSSNVQVQL
jgi:hypothetical protein